MFSLEHLDHTLLLAVNQADTPFLDSWMTLFSEKWIWILFYGIILYQMFKTSQWRQALFGVVAIVILVILTDRTCGGEMRESIARLRPSWDPAIKDSIHLPFGVTGGRFGFPSCHAANTFGLATLLSLWFKRTDYSVLLFLWAVITAYSRLYLGVHYPSDVAVGAAIGIAWGLIVYYSVARPFRNLASHYDPIPLSSSPFDHSVQNLSKISRSSSALLSWLGFLVTLLYITADSLINPRIFWL